MNDNILDILPQKFKLLEDNIDTDVNTSLQGMIDIYPEVADSYHHEIADSINIYVLTRGNKNTIKYLKMKKELIDDDFCKGIFAEWSDILIKKKH